MFLPCHIAIAMKNSLTEEMCILYDKILKHFREIGIINRKGNLMINSMEKSFVLKITYNAE